MRFASPQHALRWAYETTTRPIINTSWVSVTDRFLLANNELTAHDCHAQAALILSLMGRVLPPLHVAYVDMQYGRNGEGLPLLLRYVAGSMGTGVYRKRAIDQMIRAYCGQKISIREIRKNLQCSATKAAELRNRAYACLDSLDGYAMAILQGEMEKAGMLDTGLISNPVLVV